MNAIPKAVRKPRADLIETVYTICPVLAASGIATELGWLDEELKKAGGHPVYLRSLSDNAGWLPHFTHSLPNLFRDGGSIPAIHAKADLADTTLIGLTFVPSAAGGQIVVGAQSGIRRVADLRGRRIGLYHSLNKDKADFRRAGAERGILLALELAGLGRKDVKIVDLDDVETPVYRPAAKPSDYRIQGSEKANGSDAELIALDEGRIDAIYASGGRAEKLAESGKYTSIENLAHYPDWTLRVANNPFAATVSTAFARKYPEIVVAFLRASIHAGRWINENREAAAQTFERTTGQSARKLAPVIADVDFVPQLSPRNLAALEIQKNFVRDQGYIRKDFDVGAWADDRYLQEALRTL